MHFNIILPVKVVFRVVSSHQVFRQKSCVHFSSLPCVLGASPILSSLTWSP
jgi:hypothetical protein